MTGEGWGDKGYRMLPADVEVAEVYLGGHTRLWAVVGGATGAVLIALGVAAKPSPVVFAVSFGPAGVAMAAAAGLGWWLAGRAEGYLRANPGAVAASVTREGFWQPTGAARLGSVWRYYTRRMEDCDLPPGMGSEEYARARVAARRLALKWGALGGASVLLWFAAAIAAVGRFGDQAITCNGNLVMATYILPLYCALPAGCWTRWRRERDAIAEAVGAESMASFMLQRGWRPAVMTGWCRVAPPERGEH